MSKVAGIGLGTFLFILTACILVVLFFLALYIPIFKWIFFIAFLVFWIIWIILFVSPTEEERQLQGKDRYNPRGWIIILFSIFILLGFLGAFTIFFVVVLLHQDQADYYD